MSDGDNYPCLAAEKRSGASRESCLGTRTLTFYPSKHALMQLSSSPAYSPFRSIHSLNGRNHPSLFSSEETRGILLVFNTWLLPSPLIPRSERRAAPPWSLPPSHRRNHSHFLLYYGWGGVSFFSPVNCHLTRERQSQAVTLFGSNLRGASAHSRVTHAC